MPDATLFTHDIYDIVIIRKSNLQILGCFGKPYWRLHYSTRIKTVTSPDGDVPIVLELSTTI